MTNAQTTEERPEASLLSDTFTSDSDSDEQPTEETANQPNKPSQKDVIEALGLHAHPANKIEERTHPQSKNEEILGKERNEWDITTFSTDFNPNNLEYIIRSYQKHIENILCTVTKNGLMAMGVNKANVTLIKTWLDESDLEDLTVNTSGVFVLNASKIRDVIGELSTGNENLTLTVERNEFVSEDVGYQITIENKNGNSETITPPSLDEVRKPPDLPELTLSSKITFPLRELDTIISRFDEYSDHFLIKAVKQGVEFSTEGDVTEVKKVYSNNEDLVTDVGDSVYTSTTSEDSSLFSIPQFKKYFTQLKKSQTNKQVKIKFGNEFPVKSHIKLSKKSYSTLMVAPRIQAD